MERSHARRKTERRKRRLGLPSDEEQQPTINNNHQDLKALDEELKRRQEALEREPVRLEDEPVGAHKDENHDFSVLIDAKPPVPRYHPAAPPKRLFLDDMVNQTRRCLECGDEFMFESSLKQHYERKSIVIEINCMICKGKMIFYNKCQLLRHAREHTQNNEPMKFASPTIEPLSVKLCQPVTKAPDLNTACARSCSECGAQFATRIGLQEHMQRQVDQMTCEPCGMVLPNRCSYMAHTRIHTDTGSLVCPDCGENFGTDRSEFMKHIKLHCFHTSRILGYRCPVSGKVFSRVEYLVSHIHNNLLTRFFKCAECPIAFRSQSKIMYHTKEEHPKTAMLYRPIFKCPLCKDVFHDKEQEAIPRHILSHVKNMTTTCYVCPVCPEVFETKAELAEHLSVEHGISEYKTSAEELQAALSAQRTMKRGSGNRHTSSESCVSTNHVNGELDELDSDDSSFSDSENRRRRKKGVKNSQHPKFRFKDEKGNKSKQAPVNGKGKIRMNVCRYCGHSSAKSLQKHFQKVHNIDHMTPDMIKTKIMNGEEVDIPTTGRPVLVTPTGPISMRNMRKEPTQEELAKEDPPLPDLYHCQKCEFKARERETFQKHIKKHFDSKVDGFQCTECGNCFCSLSALEKHLYMTHKVRSILQLDRIDAKFRSPIAPSKKETEHFTFRCQTCQKTFASEEVLKQHAKSHGLDYIKGLK